MPAILIIDDDVDFAGLASLHFTKLSHTMTLAHNGKEGLAKAGAQPDIIFLDITMPDMNG